MSDTLLRAEDAARLLNMKPAGIYRLTRLNCLRAVRIGKHFRYDPEVIREFIRNGGVERIPGPAAQEQAAEEPTTITRPKRTRRAERA